MRAGRTWPLVAALLVVFAFAAPAAAHENGLAGSSWLMEAADHPGWYWPSTSSKTDNFTMIGRVERTRADSTYRNSDLAFWGKYAYAGHYDGFQIVDVSDPRNPEQVVDYACPGSQHDVSVWRGLLFVSVETPRSGPGCNSVTQSPGFEGMRIFDVSNPKAPSLIGAVPTDCGSHTHTLVPDTENGRVLLYVASYTSPTSDLAPSEWGNECRRYETDGSLAQDKISVVEVPLRNPTAARVVSEPHFPQKPYGGRTPTEGRSGCHDITVFMELEIAGSACMGEGQIWDISDLENPKTIGRVFNPNVEFWHSATFSYDGKRVIFGDEAGGGTGPACRSSDPATRGALWFYDVKAIDSLEEEVVTPRSTWKVPRIQEKLTPDQAQDPNCTMHNFNTLPTAKADVLVSSAYAAGTTMVDFSNPSRPQEVGYLDPHGANTWSAYWYNGYVYTNDGGRGVDVLRVRDRATRGTWSLPYSNPQTQMFRIR
jgi:hypothetical protein